MFFWVVTPRVLWIQQGHTVLLCLTFFFWPSLCMSCLLANPKSLYNFHTLYWVTWTLKNFVSNSYWDSEHSEKINFLKLYSNIVEEKRLAMSFATLLVSSCLHSHGLRCSFCNVVWFCCVLQACNMVTAIIGWFDYDVSFLGCITVCALRYNPGHQRL